MYKLGIVILVILGYVCLQYFVESAKPCSPFSREYGICGSDIQKN
jgi:hypothetical protein